MCVLYCWVELSSAQLEMGPCQSWVMSHGLMEDGGLVGLESLVMCAECLSGSAVAGLQLGSVNFSWIMIQNLST